MKTLSYRTLAIASLGGILEFYDFIIYALLAGHLAQVFFPSHAGVVSLLGTFATYAVGYLARPLGGLVFGHFGDSYSRKATFTLSVLMMALATLAIGCLPDYQQIGMAAPIMLTLLRIIQGFSVGGEIPGAYTYIAEVFPERQGICCGILASSITFGVVLGSLTVASLQACFSMDELHAWAWRLPFIFGGLLGLMSYRLRSAMHESIALPEAKSNTLPALTLLREYPWQCIYGFMLIGLAATTASLLYIYIPGYLQQIVHHQPAQFMWQYSLALAISTIGNTVVGYYSDKFSRPLLITLMISLTLLLSYPCYRLFYFHPDYAVFGLLLGAIPNALAYGMFPRVITNLFPSQVRYSGVAFCYSGGFAIFGGLSPLLATYLIYLTNWPLAPALLTIAVASIVLLLHMRHLALKPQLFLQHETA